MEDGRRSSKENENEEKVPELKRAKTLNQKSLPGCQEKLVRNKR